MIKTYSLSTTPKRILIITLRHLGDVLLCTPLFNSLRLAYPNAVIDVLVYTNTASIIYGNPHIDSIVCVTNKPSRTEYFDLIKKIFRHYDLSIVTQTGDRPLLYSFLSSAHRIALVPPKPDKGWWKRYLVQGWTEFDDVNTHTVIQLLQLMDVLNKPKIYNLIATANQPLTTSIPTPYAVLHLFPLWTYKRWNIKGWKQIAHYLLDRNIDIVLTGGPDSNEIQYVSNFHNQLPKQVINLAGKTSLGQLSTLISNAKLYIGPDTGVTHLASATGTPTIAIFGPTNPIKWAPWPVNYCSDNNPFFKKGNQQVNNVFLIQGKGDCVPCHLEGCEQHRASHSVCLDNLAASEIKNTIFNILKTFN